MVDVQAFVDKYPEEETGTSDIQELMTHLLMIRKSRSVLSILAGTGHTHTFVTPYLPHFIWNYRFYSRFLEYY
jgi:hypothetical protein